MTTPHNAGDVSAVVEQMVAAAAEADVLEQELAAARRSRNRAARTLSAAGMTNRSIAGHLGVSESRVARLLGYGPFGDDDEGDEPAGQS